MNSQPDFPHDAGLVDGANGVIQPGRYYSRGIPYLPINGYPGKLIAIEGKSVTILDFEALSLLSDFENSYLAKSIRA